MWVPGASLDKIFLLLLGRNLLGPRGHVRLRLLVGAVGALVAVQVNADHHQHRQQGEEHQGDHHCGGSGEERASAPGRRHCPGAEPEERPHLR